MMPFQPVPGVWLIQYPATGVAFALIPAFIYQWILPLFFFLSGASAWLALASHEKADYLRRRARRLLIPLAFGILAFTSFQQYLSLKSQAQVQTGRISIHSYMATGEWPQAARLGFAQFYPRWLWSCASNPGLGLLRVECLASHLWFLAYLFIYSLVCLPVFGWIGRAWGARWVSRLAGWSQNPLGLLALCLPAAAIQIALRARFPQHENWSDFLLWMFYFILGYLFLSDRRFLESVKKYWKIALYTGLACFALMLVCLGPLGYAGSWEYNPAFSPGYAVYQAVRSLNCWAWVLFILGAGLRRLNFNSAWLVYGSQAVLPFYILHQVALVTLAYALFGWNAPSLVKYLALAGGALLSSLGAYELLVRRLNGLRFLFGMKLKA